MTAPARFAHASEQELARILDYYQVRWEYEPRLFPILWNLDGRVVESFAPDFYLPDHEVYLEITTLRQNLVRRKNRKLRRMRELYPDVKVKLLYARDFRALMLKYGRPALIESLSGTVGQIAWPHGGRDLLDDGAESYVDDAGRLVEPCVEAVEPCVQPLVQPLGKPLAQPLVQPLAHSEVH